MVSRRSCYASEEFTPAGMAHSKVPGSNDDGGVRVSPILLAGSIVFAGLILLAQHRRQLGRVAYAVILVAVVHKEVDPRG